MLSKIHLLVFTQFRFLEVDPECVPVVRANCDDNREVCDFSSLKCVDLGIPGS